MNEKLTAAQRVAIARHPQRPNISDYIGALFTDFFECRGDRLCGEDAAILGGVAMFHGHPVTVIGTRKGKTLEEATAVTNKQVVEALGGLPAHKLHCSVLAEEAIKSAVKDYYDKNGIAYDKSKFPDCESCESCRMV